jgi:hypothetical protein
MDLSNIKFHPEEFITVRTIDEVHDRVSVFSGFADIETDGSSIRVEDDGKITVDGEAKMPTASAFKGLCKVLKIPDPFANRIPFDLLQHNIHRLLDKPDTVIKVVDDALNGHWVNFTSPRSWTVETVPLIEAMGEEMDHLKLITGEISEMGVILDFRSERIPEVDDNLEQGSITQFGRRLVTSESGFGYPSSHFLAYRLVCTNGLEAPRAWGVVKCRRRGEQEAQIASFIRRCQSHESQLEIFANTYSQVAKNQELSPNNRELHRIWNGVRKILGDADIADEIIGIDSEQRSDLRAAVKKERRIEGELNDESNEEEVLQVVRIPWFRLINRVTKSANDVKGSPRRKLQALGGKIIGIAGDSIMSEKVAS